MLFTASESPKQQNQSDDGSVDVACIGCHRSRENGTCYIVPSEDMQWALPDNRGLWCRDCFSCWRTCFSQSHSLTLFAVWLKSPVNEQAFESRLVAFLSLKREGHDRITGAMVGDRLESMKFIFQMVGLPLEPSAVVLVEEIFSENSPCPDVRDVSALSFTTIRTTSADRLGAFVPLGEIARSAEFQRPSLAPTVGCLRRCLSVTSGTDVQLAVDRMGASVRLVAGEAQVGSMSIVPWKAVSGVIAPSSKLESRMTASIANAQALLANFSHENWGDLVKEKVLSPSR